MITIVGVGIEKGDITERGKKAIRAAARVLSRVRIPVKTEIIGKGFTGSDYESLDEFIASEVIKAEKESGDAVYCALGDGFTDTAVAAIVKKRPDAAIIPGVAEYRGRKPHGEITTVAACDVKSVRYFDTRLPLMVYGIDDALIAGEVKLALADVYGDEQKAVFSSGGEQAEIALYELDRMKAYKGAALFIPGEADFMKKSRYGFTDLMAVMARLTADDGCPWDKAQTHESIRINMIEEAYEAADAIDSGDIDNLREEIGDVLLQAVFHCDIAERTGEFSFSDVVNELVTKLVTRHTHIFGENKAADPDFAYEDQTANNCPYYKRRTVLRNRRKKTLQHNNGVYRIPDSFPALLRAQKAYKKAVKAGLKSGADEVAAKLTELLNSGVNKENAGELLLYADFLATAVGADGEAELNRRAKDFMDEMKRRDQNGEIGKDGDK